MTFMLCCLIKLNIKSFFSDKHMVENESGESDTDSLEIVEDELSFEEPDLGKNIS